MHLFRSNSIATWFEPRCAITLLFALAPFFAMGRLLLLERQLVPLLRIRPQVAPLAIAAFPDRHSEAGRLTRRELDVVRALRLERAAQHDGPAPVLPGALRVDRSAIGGLV